jgi:branched-chain amino acid transport system permease protein
MSYLPCGRYFESYAEDHKWWRTSFVKGKMIAMVVLLLVFPLIVEAQWITVGYQVCYAIMAALGVQLLIGYCGQITLGHAAFVAVGAYCSAMMMYYVPWPQFLVDAGLAYPISMVCAGVVAGLWSVLFGLPSARVKGFYLIMTTMAAQFVTVGLVLTQYVSKLGDRGQAFPVPPGSLKVGPWVLDSNSMIGSWEITSDMKLYYLAVGLSALCLVATGNMLRSKLGRAWIAIRDNDIAAETMGVNIVAYKLYAFFVAGFFGGIAGSYYISTLFFVSPEHYGWENSLIWVGMILIGGVGSIQGLVFGSAFVVVVFKVLELTTNWASEFLMSSYPMWAWVTTKVVFFKDAAFGLAVILFLIYEPNGLSYRYWQIKNYYNLWPFSYTGKGH